MYDISGPVITSAIACKFNGTSVLILGNTGECHDVLRTVRSQQFVAGSDFGNNAEKLEKLVGVDACPPIGIGDGEKVDFSAKNCPGRLSSKCNTFLENF